MDPVSLIVTALAAGAASAAQDGASGAVKEAYARPLIADCDRLLGAGHPNTIVVRLNWPR